MPVPDKQPPTGTHVARHVERALSERIPSGWSLHARTEAPAGHYRVDLLAEIVSPARATAVLAVEIKRTPEPRGGLQTVKQISAITAGALPRAVPVVAASYLTPRARALLRDRGVGYVDTTGNVRIEASTPGLFISADGVDRDPWPRDHKLQSLRRRSAARAVRVVIDTFPRTVCESRPGRPACPLLPCHAYWYAGDDGRAGRELRRTWRSRPAGSRVALVWQGPKA